MKQYLDLLQKILDEGVEKESGRANMPNTIGISKGDIEMNLLEGFPLLTTKKMYWKGIVHELLWFLKGDTNIKYLVNNNVNIWNGDAYRWYLKKTEEYNTNSPDWRKEIVLSTIEEFIEAIKEEKGCVIGDYRYGDLGKVYGYQWRNQNGVDQVKEVLDGLKNNPYSRYHIIDAWNKADFKDMALPPCHLLYQFIVRPLSFNEREAIAVAQGLNSKAELARIVGVDAAEKDYAPRILDVYKIPKFYLDLNMYQRSCDTFLGVPFNIASMSLLLTIFATVNNMIPGIANWIGGDTHLYVDHLPMVKEQLSREPYDLPKMLIKKELNGLEDILALTIDDFELIDYKYYDSIKAELFTGLKK
jgi:thymidylate synthase